MSYETIFEQFNDVNDLFKHAPPSPVSERPIELMVVAKRCVYLNNYRIAGGKPYISENLGHFTKTTSLKDVLSAFKEEDVLAALAERKAHREYIKAYHAWKARKAEEATGGAS